MNKKYLGIDWGEKRIGLAIADEEVNLATPMSSVPDIKTLGAIIEREEINTLVIGKPIKMSGDDKNINPLFLNFLENIKNEFVDLDIKLVDERLTSKQADSLPGRKKDKASRDDISAMLILQSYLDYGRNI